MLVRRVAGQSMMPALPEGSLLLASGYFRAVHVHDVVIINHGGKEKVKRIQSILDDQIFVVGDNGSESTDSRDFGWIPRTLVTARVIWPDR